MRLLFHMRSRMSAALFVLALYTFATIFHVSPAAASPHDDIRPSLVQLTATAVLGEDSRAPGKRVSSEATGFIVAEDGLLLTSYHLLSQLESEGPIDREKGVTFEAFLEDGTRAITEVSIINGLPNIDLLLLKIPRRLEAYPTARIGSFRRLGQDARLFVSGFKGQGIGYYRDEGFINNEDGVRGNLATISMNLFGGQSGSPIYNEGGEVVGVAKGSNRNDPNTNYMVPIHFANPLIGYLTMEKIENQVTTISTTLETHNPKDLEEELNELQDSINLLRRHFVWKGEFSEDGSELLLKYNKLIAGNPQIAEVRYQVLVSGGEIFQRHNVTGQTLSASLTSSNEDKSAGVIRLEGIGRIVNGLRLGLREGKFDEIRVTFSPILDNSDKLESETVYIVDAGGPS